MEILDILLSAEGQIFRLSTSQGSPIWCDLEKIPFFHEFPVSQSLSHSVSMQVKEYFLSLSKDKFDITYSDLT